MKAVGLKRDNVARLSRDHGGVGWPMCARCMQPVEGFGIADEKKLGDGTRVIDVFAECRHDRGQHNGQSSRFHRDVKSISVPLTMSIQAFERSFPLLVFFADASWEPLSNPMGRATPKHAPGGRSRRGGRWAL